MEIKKQERRGSERLHRARYYNKNLGGVFE